MPDLHIPDVVLVEYLERIHLASRCVLDQLDNAEGASSDFIEHFEVVQLELLHSLLLRVHDVGFARRLVVQSTVVVCELTELLLLFNYELLFTVSSRQSLVLRCTLCSLVRRNA